MIGTQDILIGLVLVLFFFGAKRLPELAHSLGKGIKEFKKGVSGDIGEETPQASDDAPPPGRTCVSCQAALQPDWSHCPRCGTAAIGKP